ncbi:MAG: Fic family protein [Methanomassiliicoccaceae archaeon]|nr:Fic family protein [Methanomassiliicoccaceae archaeon]
MTYRPEFEIDNETLNIVSDIAVLIDRITYHDPLSKNLKLRRANKIRSIQSSLAIEGNTLSLEKVTDIIDGKHVMGDPREIREVKNALEAYESFDHLDPYSIKDMLTAHGKMTNGLVKTPGKLRDCEVGVFKGGELIHKAPEHDDVPQLINELMDWAKNSDIHPLIKGSIFHCRFEYIHPFEDGNGRMGRLWNSLILSKWKHVFSYLPVESWIKLNQKEYYHTLLEADKGNITIFVKFMLRMIATAVDELADEITYAVRRTSETEKAILRIIKDDPRSTATEMARIIGTSESTVKRYLSALTERNMIKRTGSSKTGYWELSEGL